ncbi:MAG: CrcB family protein [Candidatus Symbiobacter sp.]|nr:CrcB family protein [Candidatus Symbiobacter sp.]
MSISWTMLGIVAVGGAIGSAARYIFVMLFGGMMEQLHGKIAHKLFGLAWVPEAAPRFPWGVMGANVVGSFMMGLLVSLFASKWPISAEYRALLTTGFLGGFTTFSSFSLDTMILFERGGVPSAVIYVVLSVALSLLAFALAQYLISGRV